MGTSTIGMLREADRVILDVAAVPSTTMRRGMANQTPIVTMFKNLSFKNDYIHNHHLQLQFHTYNTNYSLVFTASPPVSTSHLGRPSHTSQSNSLSTPSLDEDALDSAV
jgi:hypothetical protein